MADSLMSYKEEGHWVKGKAFFRSWGWFFSLMGLSFFSYAHAAKKKMESYVELSSRLTELMKIKEEASLLKGELTLEIQSQSDPKWIELTLMKGLGLVPEGTKKVLFHESPRE